jgi:hypothetical protein
LERWRSFGVGPKFVRVSPRRCRYRRADVMAFLAARTYGSTAEYPKTPKRRGRKAEARPAA